MIQASGLRGGTPGKALDGQVEAAFGEQEGGVAGAWVSEWAEGEGLSQPPLPETLQVRQP